MELQKYKRNLKYHSDASHGWVGVSSSELKSLNILHLISEYSYIATDCNGLEWIYLEEDMDLGTYINRLVELGIGYDITELDQADGDHWIRTLSSFKGV